MSVYHWLVILIVLLSVLMQGNRKGNTAFIAIAVALMFCVYGLRDAYSIGNDSSTSYLHQFQRMETTDWEDIPDLTDWLQISKSDTAERAGRDRNIGTPILMKLVYDWTDGDYQVFITLISAFVMIAFAHFIQRYSPAPLQSILFYFGLIFFAFNFNALKQSVAMAFILLAFDGAVDRKPIRFALFMIVASIFHFPALVFLPTYIIINLKMDRVYPLILIGVFILTYIFRDWILEQMLDVYETAIDESGSSRFLMNKVIIMLFIFAAAFIIRPPSSEDRVYSGLLKLLGVAAVIQTFASYNNTFERLADYYFQFSVVLLPMVFERKPLSRQYLDERNLHLARTLGPYATCIFAVWRFLSTTLHDPTIYPYRFFFQG